MDVQGSDVLSSIWFSASVQHCLRRRPEFLFEVLGLPDNTVRNSIRFQDVQSCFHSVDKLWILPVLEDFPVRSSNSLASSREILLLVASLS